MRKLLISLGAVLTMAVGACSGAMAHDASVTASGLYDDLRAAFTPVNVQREPMAFGPVAVVDDWVGSYGSPLPEADRVSASVYCFDTVPANDGTVAAVCQSPAIGSRLLVPVGYGLGADYHIRR